MRDFSGSVGVIMRRMRRAVSGTPRAFLAGIAVVCGVGVAVKIAEYTVRGNPRFIVVSPARASRVLHHIRLDVSAWYWVTPWWAYALAVVVGLLGLAIAVWIYAGDNAHIGGGSLSPG